MSKGVYPRRRPTVEAVDEWLAAAKQWGPRRTRAHLLAAGLTAAQAAGVAFWLDDAARGQDKAEYATRSRYSRLLASLGPPDSVGAGRPTPPYVSPQRAA